MRLKTRQGITLGIGAAMVLLFLIPILDKDAPIGVHIAWQLAEIIMLFILSAIWHDYNNDRTWKS